jgi:hypothetical protein
VIAHSDESEIGISSACFDVEVTVQYVDRGELLLTALCLSTVCVPVGSAVELSM